jgi:hypothetical protein
MLTYSHEDRGVLSAQWHIKTICLPAGTSQLHVSRLADWPVLGPTLQVCLRPHNSYTHAAVTNNRKTNLTAPTTSATWLPPCHYSGLRINPSLSGIQITRPPPPSKLAHPRPNPQPGKLGPWLTVCTERQLHTLQVTELAMQTVWSISAADT